MSKIKTGLGRGLDALLNPHPLKNDLGQNTDYSEVKKDDGSQVDILAKIPVGVISPNPYQPRTHFEPEALDELKKQLEEED